MKRLKRLGLSASLVLIAALGLSMKDQAQAQEKKFKIYLSLSYSGNAWQSEAANIVKALAQTPPYDKTVELKEVISGTDPQAQISAYESMIQDGADGIIHLFHAGFVQAVVSLAVHLGRILGREERPNVHTSGIVTNEERLAVFLGLVDEIARAFDQHFINCGHVVLPLLRDGVHVGNVRHIRVRW